MPVLQLPAGIELAPMLEHEVALVTVQPIVLDPPEGTELGVAVKLTVGAGTIVTVTVLLCVVPPGPVQLNL